MSLKQRLFSLVAVAKTLTFGKNGGEMEYNKEDVSFRIRDPDGTLARIEIEAAEKPNQATTLQQVKDMLSELGMQVPKYTELGAPWALNSIDSISAAYASKDGKSFKVSDSGKRIYYAADSFTLVSQQVTGDCEITARVVSFDDFSQAKIGVMIREDLTPGSRFASCLAELSGDVYARYRDEPDTDVGSPKVVGIGHRWVKLIRKADQYTSLHSADGQSWEKLTTKKLTMPDTCFVGLAVCAYNTGAVCNAVLSDVTIKT